MIWTLLNCLHHTSAVPQPFLLLISSNLAQAGCLGWKWSLWPVPAWLEVQRSKAVFFLTLYDSIYYIKYCPTFCITPQPCHSHFCYWLLPIWPQLDVWAQKGAYGLCLLGWRYNWSKLYIFLTFHDSNNDMKHFRTVCITPQLRHSHFCCWWLPIWP